MTLAAAASLAPLTGCAEQPSNATVSKTNTVSVPAPPSAVEEKVLSFDPDLQAQAVAANPTFATAISHSRTSFSPALGHGRVAARIGTVSLTAPLRGMGRNPDVDTADIPADEVRDGVWNRTARADDPRQRLLHQVFSSSPWAMAGELSAVESDYKRLEGAATTTPGEGASGRTIEGTRCVMKFTIPDPGGSSTPLIRVTASGTADFTQSVAVSTTPEGRRERDVQLRRVPGRAFAAALEQLETRLAAEESRLVEIARRHNPLFRFDPLNPPTVGTIPGTPSDATDTPAPDPDPGAANDAEPPVTR